MTPNSENLSYYDRAHIWSDEGAYRNPPEGQRAETVADLVTDLEPQNILDVGAGNGIVTNRLLERGLTAVAFDFSEVALESVRGPTVVGDVRDMPFDDRSYDLCVMSEVLEHLGSGTFERALKEVARITRRHVVITVPNRENLVAGAVVCPICSCRASPHRHVRRFEDCDFADLLPGFVPTTVFPFGPVDERVRRLESAIRRDIFGRWPWPSTALCPQCGFTSKVTGRDVDGRRPLARLARPARVRRRRWLAAVLARSGKGA